MMTAASAFLRRVAFSSARTQTTTTSTVCRGFASTSAAQAKNLPKNSKKHVPLPPGVKSLVDLGLDVARAQVASRGSIATQTQAYLASESAARGVGGTAGMPEQALTANQMIDAIQSGKIARKDVKSVKIKKKKPISPGMRWYRRPIHEHLWKGRPIRKLTIAKRRTGGRNHTGRITQRHVGGGHKRRIRVVDFDRTKPGANTVVRIEYDPGRTAHIALLHNEVTKELSYILAPEGLRSGDRVESFRAGLPKELTTAADGQQLDSALIAARTNQLGNCMPLSMVPIGTVVHAVGLYKGGPGVLCRAAGASARLLTKDEERQLASIKLKSTEERWVPLEACATIGSVSNPENLFTSLGKAGRSRWLGRRPRVRGVAMNANEHPHGGGRGKSKGNKPSQSMWGTLAKGYKTRRGKKHQNKYKIRSRQRGWEKRTRAVKK